MKTVKDLIEELVKHGYYRSGLLACSEKQLFVIAKEEGINND